MNKIEVYEQKSGVKRGLAEKDGMICILEVPTSGVPLRGDVVALPGKAAGEPDSLLAFFRVTDRATVWSPHERTADTDLSLTGAWIVVERVSSSEL